MVQIGVCKMGKNEPQLVSVEAAGSGRAALGVPLAQR